MKRLFATLLLVAPAWLVTPAPAEQLIPAGSVMQCMVSQPHLSSKTMHVGDPVLCELGHSEMYGRSMFPFESYLEGRFEEYKDPGHFVGKGWMEIKFDKMVVGNDTVIPISTRVVATSEKYPVDKDGKIHGTGHPVKDTIEWLIPVLWPIDIVNLPRRGPYPELKAETRLTVMALNDFGIPTKHEVQAQPEMVSKYNYADPTPALQQQAPAPVERAYAQPAAYAPQQQPMYAQPSPTVVVVQAPAPAAPTVIQQAAPVYAYPPVYAAPPVYYPPVAYYRPYGW
jgi:hypothetical protein